MFRDTSELRQPLAKEAVAVLTGVCVGVADDVGIGVGDGQMAVHPLHLFDILINRVPVRAEDNASIAVLSDIFVSVFQVLTDEKQNSSVRATEECQDWWFVSLEVSAPLFLSPRSRGLSSSFSFLMYVFTPSKSQDNVRILLTPQFSVSPA